MDKELRILILEDAAPYVELIERQLRKEKMAFCARRVETKAAFVEALDDFAPDLILADYILPGFNALDAFRLLKQHRADMPFILVTGTQPEEVAVQCLKEGMDDYLLKANVARLPAAILNAIKKKEAEREKAQAIAALRDSEERYRTLIENQGEGLAIVDTEERFTFTNPAAERAFGVPRGGLIGRNLAEFITPEQLTMIQAQTQARRTGQKSTYDLEIIRPDGQKRQLLVTATPQFDSEGRYTGALGIFVDITERKRAEAALREISQFNQQIIASAQEGIIVLDRDFRYILWNPFMEQLSGRPAQSVLGQRPWELFPFLPEHEIKPMMERVLAGETVWVPDLLNPAPFPGRTAWTSAQLTPFRDVNGEPSGVLVVLRDITERKQAEEELRRTTMKLRLLNDLVEQSTQPFAIGDLQGRLIRWNRAFERLIGYSADEMYNLGYQQLTPDCWPESEGQRVSPLRVTGQAVRFEKEYRRKDGTLVPVELVMDVYRNVAGEPEYIYAFITDITERKQAEAAHCRYTQRLEAMQEIDRAILAAQSAPEIAAAALSHIHHLVPCQRASVVLFDRGSGEMQYVAARGDLHLAWPDGTVLPVQEFPPSAFRKPVYYVKDIAAVAARHTLLERLLAAGARSFVVVPLIAEEKVTMTLNLLAAEPEAFNPEHLSIAREIGDQLAVALQHARLRDELQRHADELERRVAERTAELESFAYSVSHDLRAPLRAIDGFSRVLLEDCFDRLDAEGQRLIGLIRSSTQKMGQLIEDLLAFSRLSREPMTPSPIDMSELAQTVFEELRALNPERSIHLHANGLPPALGDPAMIRQVLVNLLSNAIKFTKQRPTALIEVGSWSEAGQNVYYVRDNGAGFDMQYAHKLFGVFQRLHRAEEFEGTGVGLAFVQRIIHRHDGRVWAEGKVNEGATFYFTLSSA
jgi:PAS domain S-box-containing protein